MRWVAAPGQVRPEASPPRVAPECPLANVPTYFCVPRLTDIGAVEACTLPITSGPRRVATAAKRHRRGEGFRARQANRPITNETHCGHGRPVCGRRRVIACIAHRSPRILRL